MDTRPAQCKRTNDVILRLAMATVSMTSRRGWSARCGSALLMLLSIAVVALDRSSTFVRCLEAADGGTQSRRPMTKRRVARLDGDILIGALFPVHRQPSLKTAYTRQCGEVRRVTVLTSRTWNQATSGQSKRAAED